MTRTRHHEPINADCGSQHLTPLLIRRTKGQQTLVELLGEIETAKQAKPAQIALAWVSAQKPWIVPIPGTTKLNRLEENLGASVVTLSKADLAAIPAVLAKVAEQRDRYPAIFRARVGQLQMLMWALVSVCLPGFTSCLPA
ncbi:aldo/keto reductase [Bradyrhizobium sp. PMVTL-01]|uniref:aldo/keto reductase n=1 Tax=Bradyrhizobium sp. PMVTL-01 TaxID=3434999 RepID=UPI003F723DC1